MDTDTHREMPVNVKAEMGRCFEGTIAKDQGTRKKPRNTGGGQHTPRRWRAAWDGFTAS